MREILLRDATGIFSYRVAGILLRGGKILLQRGPNESHFALPGGHVEFGETGAETLVREFMEETGARIEVGKLRWIGENFFPWEGSVCHQISLYYEVLLADPDNDLQADSFVGAELIEGAPASLDFHWIPLAQLADLDVYPVAMPELLARGEDGIQHFIEGR